MMPTLDSTDVMVVDAADSATYALALSDADGPVLLSEDGHLSKEARAYLNAAKNTNIWAFGDSARKAVAPLPVAGPKSTDRWFTTATGFAGHYLPSTTRAVVAGGDDPVNLAIAVSVASASYAPLLRAGDAPEKYLGDNSGVTDTVFIVGPVPEDLPDVLSAAIS
jgi:hypothetical protein